ncbi:MAG: DUF4118 domain-containing protein, partial [Burkholderiales bacterium]
MILFETVRNRLLSRPPRGVAEILYVASAIAVPTMIRGAMDPWMTALPFVVHFPFVLVSALFLGWRAASLVAVGCAMLGNFFFMAPRYVFLANAKDAIGVAFFLLSCMMIIALAETLRRAVAEVETRRSHEAHLSLELQHRVKNMLAVVQGLAFQTFRDPSSRSDLDKFEGRIRALAGANDILSSGVAGTCRLPDIAIRALEPFNRDGALILDGPECILQEESCVPLALALHELATNAVKYGALSKPDGRVGLCWKRQPDDGTEVGDLTLEWSERGGPRV